MSNIMEHERSQCNSSGTLPGPERGRDLPVVTQPVGASMLYGALAVCSVSSL